jgi:HEAT repeat protein
MRLLFSAALLMALPITVVAFEPPTKEEVAALVKQLKDNDPNKRIKAARALETIDPNAKEAIPVLIEALKDREQDSQSASIIGKALGRVGKPAVPALIEALGVTDGKVQAHAALALKQIGPDAKEAVPALVEVVKSSKEPAHTARLNAIAALGKIGPAAKEAVATLIEATKDKQPLSAARLAAVASLGQIGPNAKSAVPTLIDLLGEEETKAGPLRLEAARAIGLIGSEAGEEAASALVAVVGNKKLGPARIVAINALGGMGPAAKNAVAALKKASEENDLKAAAAGAIQKIEK